jgi:hypothetical protein
MTSLVARNGAVQALLHDAVVLGEEERFDGQVADWPVVRGHELLATLAGQRVTVVAKKNNGNSVQYFVSPCKRNTGRGARYIISDPNNIVPIMERFLRRL